MCEITTDIISRHKYIYKANESILVRCDLEEKSRYFETSFIVRSVYVLPIRDTDRALNRIPIREVSSAVSLSRTHVAIERQLHMTGRAELIKNENTFPLYPFIQKLFVRKQIASFYFC